MISLSSPIYFLRKSFNLFFERRNLLYFLKVHFVPVLISLSSLLLWREDSVKEGLLFILWSVAVSILGFWTFAASLVSVKRVLAGEELSFLGTYKEAWGRLLKLLVIGLILGIWAGLGIILLVIPGILVMVYYAFTFYSLINGNGVKGSLRESKSLVIGRFWKVFGRLLVFLLFSFLLQVSFSLVPYGVGILFYQLLGAITTLPIYLLYQELKAQTRET